MEGVKRGRASLAWLFVLLAVLILILFFSGIIGIRVFAQAPGQSQTPGQAAAEAPGKPTPPDVAVADALFQAGKFADAQKVYLQVDALNPKDFHAALQLGHIALLANQLDDAQTWLHKALELKHGDASARIMLAEALYRKNDFYHAGMEVAGLGAQDADKMKAYATLNAAKLQSFRDDDPYKMEKGAGESTRLPFVKSDPLPLVRVRINGGPEVIFFVDTGGSELLLDTEFARELKVKPMGSVEGTFSGDQHAPVENGRIESLTLGAYTLKNVPVGMIPLRPLSSGFGVKQIDGCVGTNVLYQFLATIDYPAGELILRRKTGANLKRFEAAGEGKEWVIPFWMEGDHFMVAWGQVNALPPSLFFVDSGLAGAGVKLAESAIKQAGIALEQDKASEGAGGGGSLKIVPYVVPSFVLGEVKQENVAGLYDGPFPWENSWGFHVSGMVGNDFLKSYAVTFDFTGMRIVLR